eukprot:EG_transcript_21118
MKATAAQPRYTPLEYTVPPLPIAEIRDPLPADQKMLELAKKKEEDDAKQAEVKRQAETKKEKGGIMNKLGAVASEYSTKAQIATTSAYSTAEDKAAKLAEDLAAKRFASAFPTLAPTDKVIGDFTAKVLTISGPPYTLSGHLDITNSHICFHNDEKVAFSISLRDVVSIQKGVTLETENKGLPYVLQLPRPDVVPTTIMIYTRQRQLHVFEGVKGVKDALNILDHMWRREAGKVPVPGIQYGP